MEKHFLRTARDVDIVDFYGRWWKVWKATTRVIDSTTTEMFGKVSSSNQEKVLKRSVNTMLC
jgi:hypothetical protein